MSTLFTFSLNKKIYTISKTIALLSHPLLMPTYTLLIIFFSGIIEEFSIHAYNDDLTGSMQFLLWAFVFTLVLPLLYTLFLLKKGKISSLSMPYKQERSLPFLATGISFLLFYYFQSTYLNYQCPNLINLFLLGAIFAVLFAGIITLSWKISVHMIGIGGVTGMLFFTHVVTKELFTIFVLSVLSAGIIGFCRLFLKAHSSQQVFLGFLLGFFTQCFYIFI